MSNKKINIKAIEEDLKQTKLLYKRTKIKQSCLFERIKLQGINPSEVVTTDNETITDIINDYLNDEKFDLDSILFVLKSVGEK